MKSKCQTGLGETILQIDNEIKNSNRRETRRHQSLNELNDKADLIVDEGINIEENFSQKLEMDKLYAAISKLKPSEQELIHKLYLDKQPMTQAEYAKITGITENAVRKRVAKIKTKAVQSVVNVSILILLILKNLWKTEKIKIFRPVSPLPWLIYRDTFKKAKNHVSELR